MLYDNFNLYGLINIKTFDLNKLKCILFGCYLKAVPSYLPSFSFVQCFLIKTNVFIFFFKNLHLNKTINGI